MARAPVTTTYLFVTDGAEYDAAGVETHDDYTWSCSKTALPGDAALVYLKGGVGIAYEWEIASRPEPDGKWGYSCAVSYVGKFDPPISLREIRMAVSRAEWAAPYTNFRGFRSIRVPDEIAARLRALRKGRRSRPKAKRA